MGDSIVPDEIGAIIDMDDSHIENMEQGALTITRPAALALRWALDRNMA